MYQALHPEDKETKPEDLNIVTLENVLVNDIYNDLGFLVGKKLICLIEAQSTWTMNILIRVLLYYAKTLKEYLEERNADLYGSVKVTIPKPEFYVVYTGDRVKRPQTIRLIEEFFEGEQAGLDVKVEVLYGDKDDIIGEYVTFTKVYKEQYKIYGRTEETIKETIRICKDKNVLKEFLESREKEVVDMMVTLFDEEQLMKAHDNTVWQKGLEAGIQVGIEQGIQTGKEKGYNQAHIEGLKASIKTLKELFLDSHTVYEHIVSNEIYANVTEEEVRKYYEEL